jgi:TatA/E family protein of Tat protein translocase
MPNIGAPELIIILVIALLVIGPGKLPEVGSSLGKSLREFRKASSDVQEATNLSVDTSPLPPTPVAAPAAAVAAAVAPAAPVAAAPAAPAAAVETAVAQAAPVEQAPVAPAPVEQAVPVAPASSTDTTSVAS